MLLTDPTTGGVSASFAMVGDIHIAEPGCMIGFAGKRVIQETIREELPPGFQTAEYLLQHGMIDMVVHRKDLRSTLIRILGILLQRKVTVTETGDEDAAGKAAAKPNGKKIKRGLKARAMISGKASETRAEVPAVAANVNTAVRRKKILRHK